MSDPPAPTLSGPDVGLATAALDALDQQIAIIDAAGTIRFVNAAWRHFASANGGASEGDLGRSYLGVCEAAGDAVPMARQVAVGLRELLRGDRDELTLEYPCDAPSRPRWFQMRAVPIEHGGARFSLISHHEITAQMQSEAELRHSVERQRLIWEATNDTMALSDPQGIVLEANPAYYRLYGGTPAEVIGASFARIFPPELRAWAEQSYRDTFWSQPTGMLFESQVRSADGEERFVESRIDFVERDGTRIGMLSVVRDITEHRRSANRLHEQERLSRLIFERSPLGMAIVGPDYRFRRVNEALCRITGYSAEELLTLRVHDISHPDDLAADLDQAARLAAGTIDRYSVEKRYVRKGGQVIWARLTGGLLSALDGAGPAFLRVIEDITAQRHEDELRLKAEQRLQEAQRLESIGLLAGGIAHDFNNLLTVIIGNANLALDEIPRATSAWSSLAQLEQAAQRAAELTRQMLAYAGRGRFVVEPLDLNRLIAESRDLLRASLAKQIELSLTLDPDAPAIEADATQLRQVVMNLVINAAEAIGEQPGTISVSTRPLWADTAQLGAMGGDAELPAGWYVALEIRDTGCGIAPADLQRIFEPFFTTKFSGRGLGLAAVQGIVRRHRGALAVVSTPGVGTTFTLLLPSLAQGAAAGEGAAAASRPWRWSGTVLVIEDEPEVRALLTRMLERLGFEVLSAPDGQAGVELFRAFAARARCVFLDLTMPRLSGDATLRELKLLRPDVPVIIMSGYAEDAAQRFAAGAACGYLAKPFMPGAIEEQLRAALGPDS